MSMLISCFTINLFNIDWTSISAIISFLAFLGILLTLREMKQQRTYSYKPMIVISKPFFQIVNDNNGKPRHWKNSEYYRIKQEKDSFFLALNNIGLEAARDITLQWNINIEEMSRKLDQILPTNFDGKSYAKNIFIYRYHDLIIKLEKEDKNNIETIPFIIKGNTRKILLPESIKNYLSLIFQETSMTQYGFRFDNEDTIPLKLIIKYKDVFGREIKHIYQILYIVNIEKNNVQQANNVAISGEFSINEKNLMGNWKRKI